MKKNRSDHEILSYAVMGVSALIVNWVIYSLLLFGMTMHLANLFSWGLTQGFAFVTNKLYVFRSRNFSKEAWIREGVSFFTARGVTGVLEIVMQPQAFALGLSGSLFGVAGLQAKMFVCLFLSVVNYFCTKLFVFGAQGHKALRHYACRACGEQNTWFFS